MDPSVENQNIWTNILQSVEKRLNRQIFDVWFRPIQFEKYQSCHGNLIQEFSKFISVNDGFLSGKT